MNRLYSKGKLILLIAGMVSLAAGVLPLNLPAQENASCPSGNLNLLGMRKLMSDEWKPVNEQDELGASFDIRGIGWPISLDMTYLLATQKGRASSIVTVNNVSTLYTDLQREATTEEVSLGIKKIWTDQNDFSVFLGGGAALIRGRLQFLDVANFDESKIGWYGTTGVYWTLAKFLNLGIAARYSDVKIALGGTELNAGGWHYGFLAGLHF